MATRIALIGFGKIAHDEHWPTIAANPAFTLVATAGGRATGPDVPRFADVDALIAWGRLEAVAICTPPGVRAAIATKCLCAGFDVLLEKPPTATPATLTALEAVAVAERRVLFAGWHSQFAPAVAPALRALAGRRVTGFAIEWIEDVRRWHPGQDWVLDEGGFGVFDAGINALSMLTRLLPGRWPVEAVTMTIPANRGAPIAATLTFAQGTARFDWRASAVERRRIVIETDRGTIVIEGGGTALSIDGTHQTIEPAREYPPLYARFAELIAARRSEVDGVPLQIVTDALQRGSRTTGELFDW